jgi:hypothetical protein
MRYQGYSEKIDELVKAYEELKSCENEIIRGELESYIVEELGQLELDLNNIKDFELTTEEAVKLFPLLEVYYGGFNRGEE